MRNEYQQPLPVWKDIHVQRMLREVSEWGFWDQPASRSGKWHRPNETQWQHALGVLNKASLIWKTVDGMFSLLEYRAFLIAALFHDVGKHFNFDEHDAEAYHWLSSQDESMAAQIALHHMGKWRSAKAESMINGICSPVGLRLGALLSFCDYADAMFHWRESPECMPHWKDVTEKETEHAC